MEMWKLRTLYKDSSQYKSDKYFLLVIFDLRQYLVF